jgi:hypothetical protein
MVPTATLCDGFQVISTTLTREPHEDPMRAVRARGPEEMTGMRHVREIGIIAGLSIWSAFDDGLVRAVDLKRHLGLPLFTSIARGPEYFTRFFFDDELETNATGGADIDPNAQ